MRRYSRLVSFLLLVSIFTSIFVRPVQAALPLFALEVVGSAMFEIASNAAIDSQVKQVAEAGKSKAANDPSWKPQKSGVAIRPTGILAAALGTGLAAWYMGNVIEGQNLQSYVIFPRQYVHVVNSNNGYDYGNYFGEIEAVADPLLNQCRHNLWLDGTQYKSGAVFLPSDPPLIESYYSSFKADSFSIECNPVPQISYDLNYDNPTLGEGTYINDPEVPHILMPNGDRYPVVGITPQEANFYQSSAGIDFDQMFWDAVPNKPDALKDLNAAEALAAINAELGTNYTSLSQIQDYPANMPTTATDPATTPQSSPDTYTGDQIDYRGYLDTIINNTYATNQSVKGLESFFTTSIDKLSGVVTSVGQVKTSVDAVNTAVTVQGQKIETAVNAGNQKLTEIHDVLTSNDPNVSAMETEFGVDPFSGIQDSLQGVTDDLTTKLVNNHEQMDITQFDENIFALPSGTSSRSISFTTLGTTHTVDMQPFFTLGSIVAAFLMTGAFILGYRIVSDSI